MFRSANGEDCYGEIAAITPAGVATLALDNGMRVSGVEESDAPDNALYLSTWRVVERLGAPVGGSEEPGIWLDAFCAGLVVTLVDAADGHFPMTRAGLPLALESFRRGVGLVLDLKD
jgi:hypothetical protein